MSLAIDTFAVTQDFTADVPLRRSRYRYRDGTDFTPSTNQKHFQDYEIMNVDSMVLRTDVVNPISRWSFFDN